MFTSRYGLDVYIYFRVIYGHFYIFVVFRITNMCKHVRSQKVQFELMTGILCLVYTQMLMVLNMKSGNGKVGRIDN